MNRRQFLALAASGLVTPRLARAGDNGRKLLIVHCFGGWDTTYVFQPNFGASGVDMEADAAPGMASGIQFVDSASRPFVRSWFEDYGSRTCVINGVEVRSITHERCSRILMTGSADGSADDWGATIAGRSEASFLLPYLVLSGTAFTSEHTAKIVRVGIDAQLRHLVEGTALQQAGAPVPIPSPARDTLVDAFVRERAGAAGGGIASAYATALDDAKSLSQLTGDLSLGSEQSGCEHFQTQAQTALDAFEAGLARTALVQFDGWCGQGWDTHSDNFLQGQNYDLLFQYLAALMADLDGRGSLAQELTIAVVSEMGRTPGLNAGGGKDHWTFTSAMLVGAGVRGGQVIGGFDETGYGTDHDGATLSAAHVGATLLAIAGMDPGDGSPIDDAMD